MNDRIIDRAFVIPSIIIGVALVGGLWILGSYIGSRTSDTIAVTGSATENVKADQAKWTLDVRRKAYEGGTSAAYSQIVSDVKLIQKALEAQKFASSSFTTSVVMTDEEYKADSNAPKTFNVHETITLSTSDVDKLDQFTKQLSDINSRVSSGTIVNPWQPEYFVSSLPQLRVSLLGKAVQDAKARAVEIAKSGGTAVGALKAASSGVVQVVAPNSISSDDYGAYDTSSIQKQVMVTARVTFYVH